MNQNESVAATAARLSACAPDTADGRRRLLAEVDGFFVGSEIRVGTSATGQLPARAALVGNARGARVILFADTGPCDSGHRGRCVLDCDGRPQIGCTRLSRVRALAAFMHALTQVQPARGRAMQLVLTVGGRPASIRAFEAHAALVSGRAAFGIAAGSTQGRLGLRSMGWFAVKLTVRCKQPHGDECGAAAQAALLATALRSVGTNRAGVALRCDLRGPDSERLAGAHLATRTLHFSHLPDVASAPMVAAMRRLVDPRDRATLDVATILAPTETPADDPEVCALRAALQHGGGPVPADLPGCAGPTELALLNAPAVQLGPGRDAGKLADALVAFMAT